jgi:hypothetical protein
MSQDRGSVDLSSVLSQLSQIRSQVSGLSGQIQATENTIISTLSSVLSGVESRFRGIVSDVLMAIRQLSPDLIAAIRTVRDELLAPIQAITSEIRNVVIELISPIAQAIAQLIQMVALFIGGSANSEAVSAINVAKSEIISHVKLEAAETKGLVRQAQAQIMTALENLLSLVQRLSGSLAELVGIAAQIRLIIDGINALKSLIQSIDNRFSGLEVIINSILANLRDLSSQIQNALRAIFLEQFASFIAQIIALFANQGGGNDAVSAINVAKSEIISHIKLESAEIKALIRQFQQQVIDSLSSLTTIVRALSQQVKDFAAKFDSAFTVLKESIKSLSTQILGAIKNAIDKNEAQTKDQTKQILEAIKKALEPVLKQLEKLGYRIARVYAILGGTFWGAIDDQRLPEGRIDPENLIREARTGLYGDGNTSSGVRVLNLINIITNLSAVNYQRSGFNRFPATVPKNITSNSNETVTIYDAASWQEWLFLQLDSISGNYPIKIKYKNAAGIEKNIEFLNQAEALAELIGLTMSLDVDTDILQELAFKGIAETIKGQAAAVTASDYAKANAKYLGYRHRESERDIKLSVSPGAKSIKDALKPSTKKIPSWEFAGDKDLQEVLQALVTAGEMTKASVFRPWDILNSELPGDRIKSAQEASSNQDDQAWAEFIAQIKNPPANQLDPTAPQADIRNLAQNEGAE